MKLNKYKETINMLKNSEISGCITGSCLIDDDDKETWTEVPDIDVFVYSEAALAEAISMLVNVHGYDFGTAENPEYFDQEFWKYKKIIKGTLWKTGINTIKVYKDDITINVTYRKNTSRAIDIISTFDMTIICRAYDIETKHEMDYSYKWALEYMKLNNDIDPKETAGHIVTPNPHMLHQEYDIYTAKRWIRQWNRVIKYWDRGYNTLPVAKFYSKMINDVLKKGNIFNTEKSKLAWEEATKGIEEVKESIDEWIKSKESEL